MRILLLLSVLALVSCSDVHAQAVGVGIGAPFSPPPPAVVAGPVGPPTASGLYSYRPFYDQGSSGTIDLSLTINSITETPKFLYLGQDADATNWDSTTYGETLTAAGSGGTFGMPAPSLDGADLGVNLDSSRYYTASANTVYGFETEDIVIFLVYKHGGASADFIMGKRDAGAGSGWEVGVNATSINMTIDGTTQRIVTSGTVDSGVWHVLMGFFDRSGSGRWYDSGRTSGGAGTLAGSTDSSNTSTFKLGADAAGAGIMAGGLAFAAVWARDAWLDSHTQAEIAAQYFMQWVGPTDGFYFSNPARNSVGWMFRESATVGQYDAMKVADKWPRNIEHPMWIGGALFEGAGTNEVLRSDALDNTAWNGSGIYTINANAADSPERATTAEELVGVSGTAERALSQTLTSTLTNMHVMQFWGKASNATYAWQGWSTGTNDRAWFNLSDCTVGTKQAGVDESACYDFGDSWCWCYQIQTPGAGAGDYQIGLSDADASTNLTGDGSTVDGLIWGVDVKEDYTVSSYVSTTNAAVIRQKDNFLDVDSSCNIATGSITAETFVSPRAGTTLDGYIASCNTTGNELALLEITTEAPRLFLTGTDTVSGTTALNGARRTIAGTWTTNDAHLYIDNTEEGTPETSFTTPTGMNIIDMGQDDGETNALNGTILRFDIYNTNDQTE